MRRLLIPIGVLAVFIATFVQLPQLAESESRLTAIEIEQRGVSADIVKLKRATSSPDDDERIEALARERLGMVKRGEKAFILPSEGGLGASDEAIATTGRGAAVTLDAEGGSMDAFRRMVDSYRLDRAFRSGDELIDAVWSFLDLDPAPARPDDVSPESE